MNQTRKDKSLSAACLPVVAKPGLTLSESSWGETSGIYPTRDNLYDPSKWDKIKECQLRKARSAIHDVAKRNDRVRKGRPDPNSSLELKLSCYHMIDYFPELEPEITEKVRWFYLSTNSSTPQIHPGVPKTHIIKTYGPFHNSGGGDVPTGDVWIHFYQLVS